MSKQTIRTFGKIDRNNVIHWSEYFRIITPITVTILIFIAGTMNSQLSELNGKIDKLDNKMFAHFTNDEIHIPRNQIDKMNEKIYTELRYIRERIDKK